MALSLDQALKEAACAIDNKNKLRARRIYEKIIQGFPDNTEAMEGLKKLSQDGTNVNPHPALMESIGKLMREDKHDLAIEELEELIKEFPKSPNLQSMKGTCHARLKQGRLASSSFNKALEINSRFMPAMMGMGALLMENDRYHPALEQYKRALEIDPNHLQANLQIGRCLLQIGHPFEAESHIEKALKSARRERPDITVAMANVYRDQDNFEKSREFFEKAIELQPENVGLLMNYANTLVVFGHSDEAEKHLRKALSLDPSNTRTIRALANVGVGLDDKNFADIIDAAQKQDNLSVEDAMHLHFALGSILTKQKKYSEAFAHIEDGNYARRNQYRYNFNRDTHVFSLLTKQFEKTPNVKFDYDEAPIGAKPIFVLGMMRSGTTMTEQVISGHDKVSPRGELEFLNRAVRGNINPNQNLDAEGLLKFRKSYINDISKLAIETEYFTDKMPNNFRWVGYIIEAFPEAKIVHTMRDSRAVCWSIYKNFFAASGNGFAYNLEQLVNFYNLYTDHMKLMNITYPDRIFNLDYEKFVQSPDVEGKKLFKYLDLEWSDDLLDFKDAKRAVKTASTRQVRNEIYKGSSKEWEPFTEFVKEAFDKLKA